MKFVYLIKQSVSSIDTTINYIYILIPNSQIQNQFIYTSQFMKKYFNTLKKKIKLNIDF